MVDAELLGENAIPNTPVANNTKKRHRKSKQSQGTISTQMPTQIVLDSDPAPPPTSSQKRRNNKQKGWRQTPLLTEPNMANNHLPRSERPSETASLQPPRTRFMSETVSKSQGRRRYKEEDDQNGWATGEATDIQEMGDFDFEENLSKFDKRKVFAQIRQVRFQYFSAFLVSKEEIERIGREAMGFLLFRVL